MSPNQTVAVIDIGSNSIKLLVASSTQSDEKIQTIFAETIETRISSGISRELPRLSSEAMESGIRSVCELLRLAFIHQPKAIRIVATSAVRDALNGREFTQQVEHKTGHKIEILSGPEEARLIGRGLATDPQLSTLKNFLQIDLGGGSLELIDFKNHQIEQAISLQLGAVRLSERFLHDREALLDPATATAIQNHVSDTLRKSTISFQPGQPIVATGGAVIISRAILAAQADLTIETRSPIITLSEIAQLRKQLAALSLHERMGIPHLPAARADILPTALLTIEAVLQAANAKQLTHSFRNLRYGIAAELLQAGS
ncbi:MAG: Ppx/GppA phosphatase family protein [Coraliomargaritaceae bacterium]